MILQSGIKVASSSWSWLEYWEDWDGKLDDRIYEVVLMCNWLFGIGWYEVEEQLLELKEEESSELLLEGKLHGMSC